MKKLFRKIFRKPKKKILSLTEYDELVDSKLRGIRNFIRIAINVRDDDKEFNKQFEEAFSMYEKAIKVEISEKGKTVNDPEIFLSPHIEDLFGLTQRLAGSRVKRNVPFRKRVGIFFKRLVFKTKLYWKHIIMMREIKKMKKIIGGSISNQQALNLINASKLNKRMLQREGYSI